MRAALLLLSLLAAAPAIADPCAQYQDALAYNSCLARQGPAARAVHMGAAPAAREPAPRVHGRAARGRSELVFSPGK